MKHIENYKELEDKKILNLLTQIEAAIAAEFEERVKRGEIVNFDYVDVCEAKFNIVIAPGAAREAVSIYLNRS